MTTLTRREKICYNLLLEPISLKEAAFRMGVSTTYAKLISHRVYRKLGVKSRTEALTSAIRQLQAELAALDRPSGAD